MSGPPTSTPCQVNLQSFPTSALCSHFDIIRTRWIVYLLSTNVNDIQSTATGRTPDLKCTNMHPLSPKTPHPTHPDWDDSVWLTRCQKSNYLPPAPLPPPPHTHTHIRRKLFTSCMSSPSRNLTGLRVNKWSMRKVLGSARHVTIHLCASSRAWDALSSVYVPSNSIITFVACSLERKRKEVMLCQHEQVPNWRVRHKNAGEKEWKWHTMKQ